MHKQIVLLPVLALIAMAIFTSCESGGPVGGIEEIEFQLQPDLRVVDGGENASMEIARSGESFFTLKISDTGPNKHLTIGKRAGWLMSPEVRVNEGRTLNGVTLYSTFGEEYWAPVNYLLNEKENLKASNADVTYREIQAAIWGMLDFTGFDVEEPDAADLPDELVENGEFLFDLELVKDIVEDANSNAYSFIYTPKNIVALIAETPSNGEFMLIEESAYAFELLDLRQAHNLNVAWDLNDQGQIVGGNKFFDPQNGMLEMGNIFGRAVNAQGEVVGSSSGSAAYWDVSAGVTSLAVASGDESEATDINDNGQIVGEVMTSTLIYEDEEYGDEYEYEFNGFLWNSTDDSKTLGSDGWATSINNDAYVVGVDQAIPDRGFIWDPEREMVSLGSYYGFSSARPNAINNNKMVVGSVLVTNSSNGSLTLPNENDVRELSETIAEIERVFKKAQAGNTLDYYHVLQMIQSSTINRQIVPWNDEMSANISVSLQELEHTVRGKVSASALNNSQSEAFVWTESDGMKSLGTLGGNWSTAWDVNDNGQVVGYSDIGEGENRAFVWHEDYGMIQLPSLGGNSLARSINNNGEIVGYSYDADGNFYPVKWTVSINL